MKNKDVKLFQKAKVGEIIDFNGRILVVKETTDNILCNECIFREMSNKCPCYFNSTRPFRIRPVCLSTERPDKKSVYFEERKQIWENKKKRATL